MATVAGLAQAWVRPNYHALTLVGTPAQGAPFEVKVHGKPAQFVADVGPSMIRPGRPVAIEVESMHGTGPVHADVWQAGRWVEATSGLLREGRTRLEVAPPSPGAPALIQVYRHFLHVPAGFPRSICVSASGVQPHLFAVHDPTGTNF